MSLYTHIIDWSKNRPAFIQDAIRRLFLQQELSEKDYEELKQILMDAVDNKNPTFKAVTLRDIPHSSGNSFSCTRLLSIENPNNISSLYEKAKIDFSETGLNILFGENGTGKSSYSRILKHFCWSRQKTLSLKTNIYSEKTEQSVKIRYKNNNCEYDFLWPQEKSDSNLNSVFVYDGESASKYITEDTEIDFKPVGIEVLENLSFLCQKLDSGFVQEIQSITLKKPLEGNIDNSTEVGKWYLSNNIYTENEIRTKLSFSEGDSKRKNELSSLLNIEALRKESTILEQKRNRYKNLLSQFNEYRTIYSVNYIQKLNQLKNDYLAKKSAYDLAQQQISGTDPLPGVGSETWKELWESAKKYALTEIHPMEKTFPLSKGEKICVFCQQPLSEDAEKRLSRFNLFISDDTNAKLTNATLALQNEKDNINKPFFYAKETLKELEEDAPALGQRLGAFLTALEEYRKQIFGYISDTINVDKVIGDFQFVESNSLKEFEDYITEIGVIMSQKVQAINQQTILQLEYKNYCEKEKLSLNIDSIILYYQNQHKIQKLQNYRNAIPKSTITREIAFLLEQESLVVFNNAFDNYIKVLSPAISQKIEIKKGRASAGKVYQRSFLRDHHNEKLTEILSEGEQKVVVLANFLAECSLENDDCTIVFDDPVTSLDYKYRDTIASIFVELSKKRQIIVLTHDFYFTRLLIDTYKKLTQKEDYKLISLSTNGYYSGIPSDELPYLMKNVSERLSSLHSGQKHLKGIAITDIEGKNYVLDAQRKRMRALIEKTIEELFTGKSIERFSKNIQCREKMLSNFVCVEKSDVDLVLSLFSRYSETEHDGTPNPILATEVDIDNDLKAYSDWYATFIDKVKNYKKANNIV